MAIVLLQSDPLSYGQWEQGLDLALASFDAGLPCRLVACGSFLSRLIQLEKGHAVVRRLRQVELYEERIYCASTLCGASGPAPVRCLTRRCFRFISPGELGEIISADGKVLAW